MKFSAVKVIVLYLQLILCYLLILLQEISAGALVTDRYLMLFEAFQRLADVKLLPGNSKNDHFKVDLSSGHHFIINYIL